MNDLFRAIFGFPSTDQQRESMNDRPPKYKNNFRGDEGDNDEEDNEGSTNMDPQGGIFGFPMFYDSVELHHRFQRVVSEMNKAFGLFRFNSGPSITWEEESTFPFNEGSVPKKETLRDAYLKKPDCTCDQSNKREEFNINLNLNNDFEPGTSSNLNSEVQFSYPKMYSIFIQTVRRPDGTVETIKKVRDHTGNEETTITQSNVNDPEPPPEVIELMPKEGASGISIFRKFFPF